MPLTGLQDTDEIQRQTLLLPPPPTSRPLSLESRVLKRRELFGLSNPAPGKSFSRIPFSHSSRRERTKTPHQAPSSSKIRGYSPKKVDSSLRVSLRFFLFFFPQKVGPDPELPEGWGDKRHNKNPPHPFTTSALNQI